MGDRGPTPLVKGRWPKARGDRDRWPEGPDEGAMIKRRLDRQRVAPCGASDFLNDEKVTKESPGDAAGANFVRHVGLPPDPHYEGYPLGQAK